MEKQLEVVKQKYQIEFEIRSSPKILFNYLSTPSGLNEWFADHVSYRDAIYTFTWDDGEAKTAKVLSRKDNVFVKYKWINSEGDSSFFQMEIQQDDLTSDVALIITDFGHPNDIEEDKRIWEAQVHHLMHILGC